MVRSAVFSPTSSHPGSFVAQLESLGIFLASVLVTLDSGIADIDGCQALIVLRHWLNGIPARLFGLKPPCGTNRISRKGVWSQAVYRESSRFAVGHFETAGQCPGKNKWNQHASALPYRRPSCTSCGLKEETRCPQTRVRDRPAARIGKKFGGAGCEQSSGVCAAPDII